MRRGRPSNQIEAVAARRLREYSSRFGLLERPPVPIDLIIEKLFDLTFSWEEIQTDEHRVLAGLRPETKEIVLNERYLDLFEENIGLERFSKGHELGHWEFHVDHSRHDQHYLFDSIDATHFFRLHATRGPVWVARCVGSSRSGDNVRTLFDTPEMAQEVNRYAAALLMPEDWVRGAVRRQGRLTRQVVFSLAQEFEVSFTAMSVRLDELGIAYLSEDGSIHRSRAHAAGQLDLLP